MTQRNGPGGLPLAVYVTLLLTIPLIGLGILGVREVRGNIASVDDARAVAVTIEYQTTAIDVLAPLQVERIVAIGEARIQELGVDPESLVPDVGAELGLVLANNTEILDLRLDAFAEVLDESGNSDLADRLATSRAEIDALRDAPDGAGASIDEVNRIYESMLSVVDEFLRETTQVFAEAQPNAFDAERLVLEHALGGLVLRTANDEISEIADVFAGESEFDLVTLIAADSRHEDTLDQLLGVTDDPELVQEVIDYRDTLEPFIETWVENGVITADLVDLEPALYDDFLDLLVERLTYLLVVEEFTSDLGEEIVGFANDVADDAARDNLTTIFGLLAIGLAVFVFEASIVRSFARPLQRLRDHASRIGGGELAVEPLPVEGPSDIRSVTGAVNDMASTLVSVDGHLKGLATGTAPEAELQDAIPGEVGTSLRDSVRRLVVLTTELQRSEERLQVEARHDVLTSLLNRFGAIEALEAMLDGEATSFGVLIIDLDGFKSVNDTNGQAIGDRILLEVSERVGGQAGPDDVVARIGGDEFLIIASSCPDEASAVALGERIIESIEQPYSVGELRLTISASVGVRVVDASSSAMGAIEDADAAVYHAKQRGRGRVEMYDAELQAEIESSSEIELALRQGIDGGELRLFLQPTAHLHNGHVAGAEALVRWERPSAGLVLPGHFIPVAERSGLIIEVGRWVLRASCERIAAWLERDPECDLRLAVNVSGRHLAEGDLVADLDSALAATGADPGLLELELTESHLLDDIDRIGGVLEAVRERGVAISVDDFGTGYSSMTYLQRLPLDAVKIDRSFVARAADEEFDSVVIESIVRLGAALSLEVVAEGVETTEQLRLVHAMGVHRVQGFLLAHPMPVDDAELVIFGGDLIDLAGLGTVGDA